MDADTLRSDGLWRSLAEYKQTQFSGSRASSGLTRLGGAPNCAKQSQSRRSDGMGKYFMGNEL